MYVACTIPCGFLDRVYHFDTMFLSVFLIPILLLHVPMHDFDNAAKSTRLFSLVDFFIPLIFLTSSVFFCMVLFLLLFQSKRTKLGSLVDFSIRFIDDIIGVDILVDAVVFENDF